jgi:hypothetical protein
MSSKQHKDREKIDFKAFVDVFNSRGKDAAMKHVAERYNIQYNTVVKRLRAESSYRFDQSPKGYYLSDVADNTAEFLTIEELSSPKPPVKTVEKEAALPQNDLMLNLIMDRFFELNRFISLTSREQKIIINRTAIESAGYNIEYV